MLALITLQNICQLLIHVWRQGGILCWGPLQ